MVVHSGKDTVLQVVFDHLLSVVCYSVHLVIEPVLAASPSSILYLHVYKITYIKNIKLTVSHADNLKINIHYKYNNFFEKVYD